MARSVIVTDAALPTFPHGFLWGAATAAYQIEGAATEGGRGVSIWDTFCREPGRVQDGDTGDVACDHYHRWQADLDLLSDLGVGAYRFSVAWPRVQPDGRGRIEQRGLDFYRRLVDGLLVRGITPCLTLYHWDLPQPLEDGGGWRVRDTAQRFAEYAAVVHGALGDRVPLWITLNEPYCSAFVGYGDGRHAPGAREGNGARTAAHHLLVGHGLAVQALRAQAAGAERIGITLNLNDVRPASGSDADAAAAVRASVLQNRTFTDPLLAGRYPAGERATWPGFTDLADLGVRLDGDFAVIGTPLDFLGVNTYFPFFAGAAEHEQSTPALRTATDIGAVNRPPADLPTTEMGWPVDPTIMSGVLGWLRREYPLLPPVYITENGIACADEPDATGAVDDPDRIAYLAGHLRDLRAAMDAGADVRGYFCWSLMDNFEWALGYSKRFGLVHVDYPTQTRTPKSSFAWYRALTTTHP